ncbi:hypothetical protein JKP88DRAFT_235394 [Tribonema minus]|uniref:Secreted protein n=1 Tax=Tribonema minus TaxID=303371 RepID=A0A836CKY1_9STRA|nr:hypothetical protein JKP88DRAFT_235394 [Tribonema minus]
MRHCCVLLLASCHCAGACPRGTKCRCPPQPVCSPPSVCPPPTLSASDRRAAVADAACEHWPAGGSITKTAVFCKKLFIGAWALGVPLSLQALPGICAGSRAVESKDDVVLFVIKSL